MNERFLAKYSDSIQIHVDEIFSRLDNIREDLGIALEVILWIFKININEKGNIIFINNILQINFN